MTTDIAQISRFSALNSRAVVGNDDSELLMACRAGDETAFAELVRRFRSRAVNLSYQILHDADEAEDIAQEAFVRVFARVHSFRGDSSFGTWLYRIVINLCNARIRRNLRRNEVATEIPDIAYRDAGFDQTDAKLTVDQVLNCLPEKLRIALILREFHSLDYKEMADVLQIPIGTVRSRLRLARDAFMREWERADEM